MKSEEKLIKDMLMADKVNEALKYSCEPSAKSSKDSVEARKKGNDLFAKENHNAQIHEQIWRLYSQSISKAHPGSEELAAAYNNRSILLLHLHKYQESIVDINRALQITQRNSLRIKLLSRKAECLTLLGDSNTKNLLDEAKLLLSDENNKENKNNLTKLIDKVSKVIECHNSHYVRNDNQSSNNKNESSKIQKILLAKSQSNPLEMVSLKYSTKFGRHFVAKKNIKPGEIIAVVRPSVTSVNTKNSHAFCGHCLKACWTNIPCDYCNWCMFCSEECKNIAWEKYHDIECSVITFLMKIHPTSVSGYCTSLRLTIMAVKEAGSIENLRNEVRKFVNDHNKLLKDFTHGKFLSDSYKSIFCLSDNVPENFLNKRVDNALLNLISIAKSTTLFGEEKTFSTGKDLLQDLNAIFIGALLLKFSKINSTNAYYVSRGISACMLSKNPQQCREDKCCLRGVCVAFIPSFYNHSCMPNICRCYTEDMQLIVYASQPIKRGSQLFDNYVASYIDTPLEERQSLIKDYNFICRCPPCLGYWPTFRTIKDQANRNLDNQIIQIGRNTEKNRTYAFTFLCITMFCKDDSKENFHLEIEMMNEYKDLTSISSNVQSRPYYLSDIDRLSSGIAEAYKRLIQPSYTTTLMSGGLDHVFNFLFSDQFCIPDDC